MEGIEPTNKRTIIPSIKDILFVKNKNSFLLYKNQSFSFAFSNMELILYTKNTN